MSESMEIVFRTKSKAGRVMVGRFKPKESRPIGKITTEEVAEVIHASTQFVRAAMQQNRLKIGSCAKVGKKNWSYNIPLHKLANYCGRNARDIQEEIEAIRSRKAAKKEEGKKGG